MPVRRVELGFEGGMVLRLTVDESAAEEVTAGLTRGDEVWRSLETEEGSFWVNQRELIYIRLAPGEAPGRVGFGGT